MLKCWQWSSANRPTFSDLVKQLEEILSADEPALNRVSLLPDTPVVGNLWLGPVTGLFGYSSTDFVCGQWE